MVFNSFHLGVGRRKAAVARVRIAIGKGSIKINKRDIKEYMQNDPYLIAIIKSPFASLHLKNDYDISILVSGGGLKGQAQAIKLGLARALCHLSKRSELKIRSLSLVTQDSRCKERKKYGLRKARKAKQYSKR